MREMFYNAEPKTQARFTYGGTKSLKTLFVQRLSLPGGL
jgi:hypothetical protein